MKKIYNVGIDQGWKYEQVDEKYLIQRKDILLNVESGLGHTISFQVNFPFILNRINFSFPDENEKSIKIKVYDYDDIDAYEYLRHIPISTRKNFLLELGEEYFYRTGSIIKITFYNYTNNDIVNTQICFKNMVIEK